VPTFVRAGRLSIIWAAILLTFYWLNDTYVIVWHQALNWGAMSLQDKVRGVLWALISPAHFHPDWLGGPTWQSRLAVCLAIVLGCFAYSAFPR
jgi:hypothetical protein